MVREQHYTQEAAPLLQDTPFPSQSAQSVLVCIAEKKDKKIRNKLEWIDLQANLSGCQIE